MQRFKFSNKNINDVCRNIKVLTNCGILHNDFIKLGVMYDCLNNYFLSVPV